MLWLYIFKIHYQQLYMIFNINQTKNNNKSEFMLHFFQVQQLKLFGPGNNVGWIDV